MLYKIFWQRSKWLILLASLIIIGSFSLSAKDLSNQWHQNYDYYHSKEFNQYFDETPKNFLQGFKKGSTKADYIRYNLTLHSKNTDYYLQPNSDLDHTDWIGYLSATGSMSIFGRIFFFLFLGFAIFFIDLKTHFNKYLLSLNVKRSTIFRKKVIFYSLIVFISTLMGCIIAQSILCISIPSEYLNVTFLQSIYASICTTLTYFTIYIIGLACGVVLGHMVLGPLSIVLVFYYAAFVSALLPYSLTKYLATLQFIATFYGIHPYLLAFLVIAIVCGLSIAYYSFSHTSLEENGNYILVPKLRLPIFLLMSVGTSLFFFYGYVSHTLVFSSFKHLFYFLFIWGISTFLVYHQALLKKWRSYQEKRG
ncbi:ABC transporter permease [Enterococcus columbae]|uniref:ABC transporter permease n=1 Tax=Enterococcus columbae DSM 7374 = ATCC 51263 TaxID=1121865 RepID=S1N4G0_9ENTE|nr:ABC transporter permease [Enterococcus columbae]EOT41946.1 hypothetical protein OMW_01060 [Enterococcus columbae DSM 7374 = ATCC 51263]EOW80503.1 hypothetical protein I568_01680 [Enterococcus columbae DSM 7374 = ATCC 51263]OJG26421.1 hypothetical protein RR47_GL000169 [Enterococcus columbae DSM 7374 = ATCC 51263]